MPTQPSQGNFPRRLVPVKIHKELEAAFKGLQDVTIYFIDYVLRLGCSGGWRKKVVVITARATFVCDVNGSINRCIEHKDVVRVVIGGVGDHVGLYVPTEGSAQPSFDVVLRTGNRKYLENVLRCIIPDCRSLNGLTPCEFYEIPSAQYFPTKDFNLVKPPGWTLNLEPEILNCVSTEAPQKQQQEEPSVTDTPRAPPPMQVMEVPRRSPPQVPSVDPTMLLGIMDKLSEMQKEIKELRSAATRGDSATREMSLKSFEEVKAIRQELASEGLVAPSAAWRDYSSSPRRVPPGGVPGKRHGVEGYWVPAGSPVAKYRAPIELETDDELPGGVGAGVRCWHCQRDLGLVDPLPRCSVCRKAVYCGRQCQTVHWARHKMDCQSLAEGQDDSETSEDEVDPPPRPIYIVQSPGGESGVVPSPSPVRPFYQPVLSPRGKKKKKPKIPPPPKLPPSPSHLPPDAERDRVHSTSPLPGNRLSRPPPPPAPPTNVTSASDYDTLFNTYKEYYANVLKGDTPSPPRV
eukprot:TRINITY_DN3098_c0_g2_i1.p1 TRINITY_DN3098_c0_g2~~TRINITY_DN3098_c0_g2_i1.p1  ORF type:complete len:518 (+),score=38.35 TRINITY_DN3098_c0_g2_i1:426-1979(+)